jgi:Ras-related GTP-binding protein C/D
LCLVSVIKHPDAKDKKGLLDYNAHIFQDALNEVFARGWEKQENGEVAKEPLDH